jgi:hypothetical protein
MSCKWSILNKPAGSASEFIIPDGEDPDTYELGYEPCFIPDLPGDYVVQLVVNDGELDSDPETVLITAQEKAKPIPGDLDGDGDVDMDDRNILVASFAKCEGAEGYNADADYDGSGCVNFLDYRIWLNFYMNQL